MIVFSYLFIYFFFVVSIATSHFSFLILFIWFFFSPFLVSLARGLSILFTFSKKQLLVWLILSIVFWISILLISSLIFMISFLLLILVFLCSFSNSFRWWVKLSNWDFSSFLRNAYIAVTIPLNTAFVASHRFWMVLFLLSFFLRYFF